MRFSIFTLMAIMTAAGINLALSQLPFEIGITCLILITAVSMFVAPKRGWRYCFYGGIGGVVIGIVLMTIHTYISLGHFMGSYAVTDFVFAWRPWILFGGSWTGFTAGLLLFQNRKQIASPAKTVENQSGEQL